MLTFLKSDNSTSEHSHVPRIQAELSWQGSRYDPVRSIGPKGGLSIPTLSAAPLLPGSGNEDLLFLPSKLDRFKPYPHCSWRKTPHLSMMYIKERQHLSMP